MVTGPSSRKRATIANATIEKYGKIRNCEARGGKRGQHTEQCRARITGKHEADEKKKAKEKAKKTETAALTQALFD